MHQNITLVQLKLTMGCEFKQRKINFVILKLIEFLILISVVTGVRFANRNETLFLQVQVGKLIGRGMVNTSTIYWKSLPEPEEIIKNEIVALFGNITFDENCYFAKDVITGRIKKMHFAL